MTENNPTWGKPSVITFDVLDAKGSDSILKFSSANRVLLKITHEGKLELGYGASPDEATRAVFESLKHSAENFMAAHDAAIRQATIEECVSKIKSCGSLDENGYICEKSQAIAAIRSLGSKDNSRKPGY
jgi:hypothetical protein